jgi:hypothetical protein
MTNTTKKSTIQTKSLTKKIYLYFGVIFTDQIDSIANSIDIYQHDISVGKYRENPRWNKRNSKKSKSTMMCNFLWMLLPTKL